jgi:arylsulfatase A-like enzyme
MSQDRNLHVFKAGIRKMNSILRALFPALLLIAQGCAIADGTDTGTSTESKRWSVLLITVDCMRPDHMSLYGYERETTPQLAKFAEGSMVFENAFATSGWTSPGVVSLLTGYYPPVHGQNGRFSFYDKTLASPLRVLAAEGYDILGQETKGANFEGLGFQRKRDQLEYLIRKRSDSDTPFFAWIHLRETHLPYRPSDTNAARWSEIPQATPGIEAIQNYSVIFRPRDVDVSFKHAGNVEFDDQDIPVIRSLYDGEMADADDRLGRALRQMEKTGLLDRTVVIISADHGEELFEHGWVGHASTSYDGKLYDEIIRIPLIIRLPDQSVVGRLDPLVQGVDVMPTIFDLLEIPADRVDPPMQGNSLLSAAKGESEFSRRYVFSQTTRKGWTTPLGEMNRRVVSVRSKTHKLIRFPEEDGYRVEGYHLEEDPQELKDIYASRKQEFAQLERAQDAWDEENRRLAAELVLSGAEKRLLGISGALSGSELLDAVRDWESIAMLERTWGLEVDPFLDHEPYTSHWRKIRGNASRLIAKALECDAQAGTLRQVGPDGSFEAEDWLCDR